MDMDLPGRVGVEWVSKFCPVKGSSLKSALILRNLILECNCELKRI